MGVVLQFLRTGQHRFIALHHLTGNRCVHVFHGLHRLHRAKAGALRQAGAHIRQIHEHDVAQLINGEGTDAHPHQLAIGIGVLVAVGEAKRVGERERHRGSFRWSQSAGD